MPSTTNPAPRPCVSPATPAAQARVAVSARAMARPGPMPGISKARPNRRRSSAGADSSISRHRDSSHGAALARSQADGRIPLIVGGHSHTYLDEGLREGETLIVQAGDKATVVGRVDLWFDVETRRVLRSEAQLVELPEEFPNDLSNSRVDDACAQLLARSSARMDEVVGRLSAPLQRSWDPLRSSAAGNLIAEIGRELLQSDVGLMNRGGIRADLDSGDVTRRALFELCPFDNYLVEYTMTGTELFETLRRAVETREHSGIEVSGAVLEVLDLGPGKRTLERVHVHGEPIAPGAKYTVAMNSFMAGGGDGYVPRAVTEDAPRVEDPRLLRELLEEYFSRTSEVIPDESNAYMVMQPAEAR